jgi:hypothetical protein
MGQAVLALLSVIVGATIAGSISLWQVQLVTRREREARHALREQERKDRRDAFQRETILALQDVFGDLHKAVGLEQDRMITAAIEGAGTRGTSPSGMSGWSLLRDSMLPEDFLIAHRAITKLQSRVIDGELRTLALGIRDGSSHILLANSYAVMDTEAKKVDDLVTRFHDRVAKVLPDLF